MKKILLGRKFNGLGDWVMFTSLIKHINLQHPDWLVSVDTTKTPLEHLQFLCKFDIRVIPVCNPDEDAYDEYIAHVVYDAVRRPGVHLLEDMVDRFNYQVGVSGPTLSYDRYCLAKYSGIYTHPATVVQHAVLIAPENSLHPMNACKGWGFDNFMELARVLQKSGLEIIQVGIGLEGPLWPGLHKYFKNVSLATLLDLMTHTQATVTLENGISHFAGHHGIKTYTIYRPSAPTQPKHAWYPNQEPVCGEIIYPEQLAEIIIKRIANRVTEVL